jgi:putative glutamine amidotransferase
VGLAPASRLAALFGADELEVNSRHHQAVLSGTLAAGLVAVATSPDGIVEAVESRAHRWVVGVQWHPERPEPQHPAFAPAQARLFKAFVAAAARRPEEARRP